jgi:NADPH:quinone reductase-like Zn-dependent oxidoreductase
MEERLMMKALVRDKYGKPDILRLEEVEPPTLEDDRILVRVKASSVNRAEWYGLIGRPLIARPMMGGMRRPRSRLIGTDFAGVVEAVGKDVEGFAVGDEVFGGRDGAYAEYVAAKTFAHKPANVSFEEAGCVGIAGLTALQAVRDQGELQPGERVLVNGASGGVGTMTVQIAKALGGQVTAVCSTHNVERIRQLGADRVIDYTQEDFTRKGDRYDLVLDVAGSRPWRKLRRVLAPGARVVIVGAPSNTPFLGPLGHIAATKIASRGKARFFVAKFNNADLQTLANLLESGELKPAIDRTYDLTEASEALRTFGEGHVRGKLVLTI